MVTARNAMRVPEMGKEGILKVVKCFLPFLYIYIYIPLFSSVIHFLHVVCFILKPTETSLDDQQGFADHQLSPLLHGQTVHAHASDKPKAVNDEEHHASSFAIQKAMDVKLKADREHQKKLKNLKEKLRKLREKLHILKTEYDGDSSEGNLRLVLVYRNSSIDRMVYLFVFQMRTWIPNSRLSSQRSLKWKHWMT